MQTVRRCVADFCIRKLLILKEEMEAMFLYLSISYFKIVIYILCWLQLSGLSIWKKRWLQLFGLSIWQQAVCSCLD